ncbi:MAG: hypothetical protein Q9217_000215 [Psora testacea]
MRIRGYDICKQVLCNYIIVSLLCCYLIVRASINIATTIYPLLHHLPVQATNGCNGRTEYCDRTYDNITQIATHGSTFYGILPTQNQNFDITAQLNAGVRFLQAQTHRGPIFGELKLCHTDCMLEDAGALEDYLLTIKDWLNTHSQEVVSLLLTNGDFLDVGAYEKVFSKVGINDLAYVQKPASTTKRLANGSTLAGDHWPTLGEMIEVNQRLVIFLDYGADTAEVPYILNEFQYFWETPFDTTDPLFPQCAIHRPRISSESPPGIVAQIERRMYIVNHYLDTTLFGMEVPNRRDAKKTNAISGEGSIGAQARLCETLHAGKKPRVIMVDYFDVGQTLEAQEMLNGF